MSFEVPNALPMLSTNGTPAPAWAQWTSLVNQTVTAQRMSGSTANRPTKGLWIGRVYFDTDLGHPVWVQSVNPAVWVDATGGAV